MLAVLSEAEYQTRVADLAALARFHRFAAPHPWPPSECLMCRAINRQREELRPAVSWMREPVLTGRVVERKSE